MERRKTLLARLGNAVLRISLPGHHRLGLVVEGEPGQHLLVADAPPRITVHFLDQLLDRVPPVAYHVARNALGDGDEPAVDHQHPVVLAGDEALDDDASAVLPRDGERPANLVGAGDVDGDPAAVVAVERLHHHGVADLLRRLHRVLLPLHQALSRHREAEFCEDAVGLLLVRGQLDGDVRGAAGDGGLHPLLVTSVAELDEALLVEPDPGDLPLLRRPHQRHGARPQVAALRVADELVPLGREVEALGHRPLGPQLG